jgi:hypothetical protein
MAQEDQYRRFEIAQNALHAENNVFWTRFSGFATLQAGLLVITTAETLKGYPTIIIAVFGVILAHMWMRVNQLGVLYVDRWKQDHSEERDELFPRAKVPSLDPRSSATDVAQLAPWLVGAVWGIVAIMAAWSLLLGR